MYTFFVHYTYSEIIYGCMKYPIVQSVNDLLVEDNILWYNSKRFWQRRTHHQNTNRVHTRPIVRSLVITNYQVFAEWMTKTSRSLVKCNTIYYTILIQQKQYAKVWIFTTSLKMDLKLQKILSNIKEWFSTVLVIINKLFKNKLFCKLHKKKIMNIWRYQ